jgi:hypothetical protein
MTPIQIEDLVGGAKLQKKPNLYQTNRVPKPHEAFESYLLLIDEQLGLCKITAIGKNVSTSVYGDELKSAFGTLEEQLTVIYGRNKKFRSDSIWNEGNDWMMALLKKERILATFWNEEHKSSLKDNIKGIALEAKALRPNIGFISLSYEFENINRCSENSKARKSDVL